MAAEDALTMAGKVCLVTGATSGIGEAAAHRLAQMGATVIVHGRDVVKAARVASEMRADSRGAVDYLLADFAALDQVRGLAAEVQSRYERLDVLVNNAGAMFMSRGETADGIERTLQVNHLAHFLLTNLLLGMLQASAPARIVNVASDAHERAELDFDDLQNRESYSGMDVYGQSKLANVYFTYELARRLEGTGVTANALHPGFIGTNIGANNIPVAGGLLKRVINLFAGDVEEGAETIVYVASAPDVAGVTGQYFVDCAPVSSNAVSYNEAAAAALWRASEELVGLAPEETA